MAYETPKFMLPIRLGMVNAAGPQELFVYALTRKGRVETTNYRTVRLPSDAEVPLFVKDQFGPFYKAMFNQQVKKQEMRDAVPRVRLGHGLVRSLRGRSALRRRAAAAGRFWNGAESGSPGAQNVFLTRLHLRYDAAHFPEDLVFQETADRENFQGRFILRHPWTGKATCQAGQAYRRELPKTYERQAATLASLTGWDVDKIRGKMNLKASATQGASKDDPWWKQIWTD